MLLPGVDTLFNVQEIPVTQIMSLCFSNYLKNTDKDNIT